LPVRIAYVKDFGHAHTLLIDGDADGLRLLAIALEDLSLPGAEAVEIHALPFVIKSPPLSAASGQDELGVSVSGQAFTWLHTSLDWTTFAQLVRSLASEPHRHQYLDSTHSDIQVVVTHGEGYDEVFS
jgi:hypothetical protein